MLIDSPIGNERQVRLKRARVGKQTPLGTITRATDKSTPRFVINRESGRPGEPGAAGAAGAEDKIDADE